MRAGIGFLCVALGACTVVNDPGRHQGGPGLVQASEFCRIYAELVCDGHFDCCSAAQERSEQSWASCVREEEDACARGTDLVGPVIGEIVVDGRTGYDPRIAAEALEEGRALTASCSTELLWWRYDRMGLQRGLTGTVAPGEECTPGPLVGLRFDFAALFSCEGANRACVESSGQWDCLARRDVDGRCRLYWDCQDGMYCTSLLGGTCQPRKPEGESCDADVVCESLHCGAGRCAEPTPDDVYCR